MGSDFLHQICALVCPLTYTVGVGGSLPRVSCGDAAGSLGVPSSAHIHILSGTAQATCFPSSRHQPAVQCD